MREPGNGLITVVRPIPRPILYVLLAGGFFVIAVAGIVMGTVAEAHQLSGFSHLAAVVVGLALGLMFGLLARAYFLGVSVPSLGRQLTAMVQAMEAGQPVSGSFWAGLRDLVPKSPSREEGSGPGSYEPYPLPGQRPRLTRWLSGRVVITPESVIWHRTAGRARDLTGAECTAERQPDPSYTEMTLTKPRLYHGEPMRVITLQANGTDVELVTQVQLLEILRYSLARTRSIRGSDTGRLGGSSETS
jgi:hypothetical protein